MAARTEGLPVSGKQSATTTHPDDPPPVAAVFAALVVFVLMILGIVYSFTYIMPGVVYYWHRTFGPFGAVEYTVTIAAVSGLDPAKDLQPHQQSSSGSSSLPALLELYPAFNLTLGVASPSTAYDRECIKPGTTVEVSYLRSRVPLATGPAPELCVEVGERREEASVVAWGDGVRLPGFVLDSLTADMLRGDAEFGVRLTAPVPYCSGGDRFCSDIVKVMSCWAKIGGGPGGPCKVSWEEVSFPPVPRPGKDSAAAYPLPLQQTT